MRKITAVMIFSLSSYNPFNKDWNKITTYNCINLRLKLNKLLMKKNKKYDRKGLASKIIPNFIQYFDAYIRLKLNKPLLKENKKYDKKNTIKKIQNIYIKNRNL